MNDIQKAMAFLREEHQERVGSAAPLSVVSKSVRDVSASDVEQASSVVADLRLDKPRRVKGIGDDVSAAVAAPSVDSRVEGGTRQVARRDTDAVNGVREASRAVEASVRRPRARFDDAIFEDDVLDGIGTSRAALDVPESDGISSASTNDAGAAIDMPELGIYGGSSPSGREGDTVSPASDLLSDRAADESASPTVFELNSAKSERAEPAVANGERAVDGRSHGERTDDDEGVADGRADAERHEPDRVVSLPLKRLADHGFLTPGAPKGRLSEEFRRVKRPILRNIADAAETSGHSNVVMITSSVAGEGKTYTAINLAMSLATERRRTVLLVDADVLKGSAGAVLGIGGDRPGLTDVLDDERLDIADVMLATDVPDLRFVPAGRRDEHTTELLSSPRMSDLIDELARRYSDRIIVLDCPPMLQTNEANVIADHAGQVVFVVAGEETDQRLVLEAMSRFEEGKSVGVLLNKASGSSAAYGYDYGYG